MHDFAMERLNQEYSQALPEAVRSSARLLLLQYQAEARQGKPWPPASPYLTKALDAQIPGLKLLREQREREARCRQDGAAEAAEE